MVVFIAIGFALVMITLSIWANARFRHEPRLPMQWSASGKVNWSAPRLLALSFMPALAIIVLTVFVVLVMSAPPSSEQDNLTPAMILVGCVFVAAHVFHIWLADKTLRHNGKLPSRPDFDGFDR